jgi:hypothetical protein
MLTITKKKPKVIRSYEDACRFCGLNPNSIPDVSMMPYEYQRCFIAYVKLVITIGAIRQNWRPDWNNRSQRKYYNWFDIVPAKTGSGFVFSYTYTNLTDTTVGAAFTFETESSRKFWLYIKICYYYLQLRNLEK